MIFDPEAEIVVLDDSDVLEPGQPQPGFGESWAVLGSEFEVRRVLRDVRRPLQTTGPMDHVSTNNRYAAPDREAVLSVSDAARALPIRESNARAWLRASGLVSRLAGREVVVWGAVLDALQTRPPENMLPTLRFAENPPSGHSAGDVSNVRPVRRYRR